MGAEREHAADRARSTTPSRRRARSARAAERADWLRRPRGTFAGARGHRPGARPRARRRVRRTAGSTPPETRELLEAFGIPLVPERVVSTADEAAATAAELGFPVVVKTAAAGRPQDRERRRRARPARRGRGARGGRRASARPCSSSRWRGGVELLAGVVQDPVFGPLVAFGPGGVQAELIGDAGFRTAPLTDADADELVRAGKAGRLVAGFRGAPPPTRPRCGNSCCA